jgi:ATP-binding protein involved in chromosome partitioning
VIENMSYYQLPDGERDYIFGEGGADRWAEQERLPVLGHIPITRALRESGDRGAPLVVAEPDNPSAVELRRAARMLAGQVSIQSLSSLPVL